MFCLKELCFVELMDFVQPVAGGGGQLAKMQKAKPEKTLAF
jgi:hypothetical protein